MPKDTCKNCGKEFKIYQTPEERLLSAIFGEEILCKKCRLEKIGTKCRYCGGIEESIPIKINSLPICSRCLGLYYDQKGGLKWYQEGYHQQGYNVPQGVRKRIVLYIRNSGNLL